MAKLFDAIASACANAAALIKEYVDTVAMIEEDPTVPAWAKASKKPSYTPEEVGLGNVDNVKQYSEDNQPPYPVTSVNGKTGAVVVRREYGANAFSTRDTWTDGKVIYCKVLTGEVKANTAKTFSFGYTAETIVKIEGGILTADAGTYFPLNYYASGGKEVRYYANSSGITVTASFDGTIRVVAEFTRAS